MKKVFDATCYFIPKNWFFGFDWDHKDSQIIDGGGCAILDHRRFYTLGICVVPMFKLQVRWDKRISKKEFEDEQSIR